MAVIQGKTKRILPGPQDHTVYLETFDVLTGGDAAKREEIAGIRLDKTGQAANVFALLNRRGIPTAFREKAAPDRLLCDSCAMLPLEFVVRRYAWGSCLLRNPSLRQDSPYRFGEPESEIFHKNAVVTAPPAQAVVQMSEDKARDLYLRDGVWAKGVYTDPYVRVKENGWALYPQKAPFSEDNLLMTVEPVVSARELADILGEIVVPAFLALEEAWSKVDTVYGPVTLVDLKVELGRRTRDGKIVLADVIDNDSWRIWPGGDPAKQLDKQCFRDNDPLSKVSENYRMVTQLTEQF